MTCHVAAPDDVHLAEIAPISRAAMNVAEVAGAADLEMLGAVAMGIVAMADSWTSAGLWHADALRVHLASLNLVMEAGNDQGRQIVQQLQALRRSIGVSE